ncbi:DUF5675 family protein [Campylobacter sp. RM12637]|uniref:DUF5675 family protein n=1 Tax=Campylobacter sp. RM12637 TaxID=2735734 RepID=UPI003014A467|nr:hypothetical protein [Campylobacter sp. RM12637]
MKVLRYERFLKSQYGTFSKVTLFDENKNILANFTGLECIGEPTNESGLKRPIKPSIYAATWIWSANYSPVLKIKIPHVYSDELSKNRLIRIHHGSWLKDTIGCLLLGLCFLYNAQGEIIGIGKTRLAMKKLYELIGENDFIVEVIDAN